jgi:hypothetical protein
VRSKPGGAGGLRTPAPAFKGLFVARWVGAFLVVSILAGAIAFLRLNGNFIRKEVKPATIAESNGKKLGIERPRTDNHGTRFRAG